MKRLARAAGIFDRSLNILASLACVVLIFITLSVCAEVVMRYFLNRPIIWVVEISEYALLFITFLGSAWLLKRKGHVEVDILLRYLNPRTQALLGIISSIMGLIICWVFVRYGVDVTWDYFVRGVYRPTSLEIPTFFILLIIPLGGFFLLIQFLRRGYGYWRASQVSSRGHTGKP